MKNWSIAGGEFKFHGEFHSVPRPFYCNVITIVLYKHALMFSLQISLVFDISRKYDAYVCISKHGHANFATDVSHNRGQRNEEKEFYRRERQESRANVRR